MTIVAWDGKTLSSDSLMMSGTLKMQGPSEKIIIPRDNSIIAAIGMAGSFFFTKDFGDLLLEYYDDGELDFPYLEKWLAEWCREHKDEPFEILIIKRDKQASTASSKDGGRILSLVGDDSKRWAIGCGDYYAIGAMCAGASSQEAVMIACKYDAFCGGSLQSVRV